VDFRQLASHPLSLLYNRVSITALHGKFRILIWPGSHRLIEEMSDFHGGTAEGEEGKHRVPGFEPLSSEERDKLFCRLKFGSSGYGSQKPVIVVIEGEMLTVTFTCLFDISLVC
jgi:hypothetical protein